MNNAAGIAIWISIIILYWVPTIVAFARQNNRGPVTVVNCLLGWTIIGWIIALAMAVRDSAQAG
jgi:hypothetical protein